MFSSQKAQEYVTLDCTSQAPLLDRGIEEFPDPLSLLHRDQLLISRLFPPSFLDEHCSIILENILNTY